MSGFSKRKDLQYFARAICKADYVHLPELAPSEDLFHARKKENMNWKAHAYCVRKMIPIIAIAGWWPNTYRKNGAMWRSSI